MPEPIATIPREADIDMGGGYTIRSVLLPISDYRSMFAELAELRRQTKELENRVKVLELCQAPVTRNG
jgi:hypothetical protein